MILITIIITHNYLNYHNSNNDRFIISITEVITIIGNSSKRIGIIPLTIITSCIMILHLFS